MHMHKKTMTADNVAQLVRFEAVKLMKRYGIFLSPHLFRSPS